MVILSNSYHCRKLGYFTIFIEKVEDSITSVASLRLVRKLPYTECGGYRSARKKKNTKK